MLKKMGYLPGCLTTVLIGYKMCCPVLFTMTFIYLTIFKTISFIGFLLNQKNLKEDQFGVFGYTGPSVVYLC